MTDIKTFDRIRNTILDLIFPKNCFGCGKEGNWFCSECAGKIKFIKTPTCYICRRISESGKICPKCQKKSCLKGVVITANYSGILRDALIGLKYQGLSDIVNEIFQFMIKAISEQLPKKEFIIVPIPLYRKRLVERGFNQSELLANLIAKEFDWKIETHLKKIKQTLPQVGQKRISRLENIKDCFVWQGGSYSPPLLSRAHSTGSGQASPRDLSLKGKNVVLIDDVLTTGSTLEEAARVLKEAGARSIWGAVLCRGQFRQI